MKKRMLPERVTLVEVGPRDGLQNEPTYLSPSIRAQFIQKLAKAGLSVIECGSFVSYPKIPALKNTHEVMRTLGNSSELTFEPMVLVPNRQGFEEARLSGVQRLAVFTAASETFNQKNIHASIEENFSRMKEFIPIAKSSHFWIRAYISCVWGCPYEGEINAQQVLNIARGLLDLGCDEISLGDTIGVATPCKVVELLKKIKKEIPIDRLAVHFHDTYGQALANIWGSLNEGVSVIDASVSGLGGCPYAVGASGNVATEDVLYLLNGAGIETGVDLGKLIEAGDFINHALNRTGSSKVARAWHGK